MKKSVLAIVLIFAFCVGLAGCGSSIKKQSELSIKEDVKQALQLDNQFANDLYKFYVAAAESYAPYYKDGDAVKLAKSIITTEYDDIMISYLDDVYAKILASGDADIVDSYEEYRYSDQSPLLVFSSAFLFAKIQLYDVEQGVSASDSIGMRQAARELVDSIDNIFEFFYGQKLLRK